MVTKTQLGELYPRASPVLLARFASQSQSLFARFGISALPNRLHFFLAQIGHESGGLTILEENMSYSAPRMTEVWPGRFPTLASALPFERNPQKLANNVYANRMGNGPSDSGDGYRYRGRGFIQITGRDGYRAVGNIVDLDLETDPERAADLEGALKAACGFWAWKQLNALADTGDFTRVTRRINGGTTGLADRQAWLSKVRRVLSQPPAASAQPPAERVRAIQLALGARGFSIVGAADGIVGPHTAAAIALFRQANGLSPGGIDDQLLSLLAPELADA